MARAGRPSKSGRRLKSGRRVDRISFDRGADHVERRRSRFAGCQGGKAADQVFDPIGRAWAVGLLENHRVDPAVLRDAGRDYAARYWNYYPRPSGVSNYLAEDRGDGSWSGGDDPGGERFQRLDMLLKDAGRAAYDAAHILCLDFYWFPDDNPAWLGRLIDARLEKANDDPTAGRSEGRADLALLHCALEGLLALAEGTRSVRRN